MATKKPINLGEELAARLTDFCEANYGAPQTRVIKEAVDQFISERLKKEPELKKRYEIARAERLGQSTEKVRLVQSKKD